MPHPPDCEDEEWIAVIRRGNFSYDRTFLQTGAPHVPIYVANGVMGGAFDEFGFQSRPQYHVDHGRTHLGYVNHYAKDPRNGGHDLASLCFFSGTHGDGGRPGLAGLSHYRQEFNLPTAVFRTEWAGPRGAFDVSAFASFADQGLFVWELGQQPSSNRNRLEIVLDFRTGAADAHGGSSERNPALSLRDVGAECAGPGAWKITSATNCRSTETWCVVLGAEAEFFEGALSLRPETGRCVVLLYVVGREEKTEDVLGWLVSHDHAEAHREAARAFWEQGALVDIPDETAAKIWLRGRYFLRASLPSFPTHVHEPTGLNANIWGHGFPQDVFYIVENLPRLGLHELAHAQFPIWLEMLPGVLRYTKRLTGCEGAFFPWTPPFEDLDGFEVDSPTNADSYEFHNSAYVAAIIWHAWLVNGDKGFLRRHRGILREVARFYDALCVEGPSGRMRVAHPLIRSQDEHMAPGEFAESPLCAMISARAALRYYVECCEVIGVDDAGLHARCRAILRRDFDFAALRRSDGTLKTTLNDARPPGRQKHPLQLNPIALLPQPDLLELEPAFVQAWRDRLRLTADAEEPRSHGWTFALFALASARMGDGEALQADLDLVQPARYADGQWFQFYESSCRLGWQHKKPYYFPTSGLYLQALTEAVAQDWRGRIDFFSALPPSWRDGRLSFRGLQMRGGIIATGWCEPDGFRIKLAASRDFRGVVGVGGDTGVVKVIWPDGRIADEAAAGFDVELAKGQRLVVRSSER